MLRVPSKFDSPCVRAINGSCDVIDCPFVHDRIEQQFVKLSEEELKALLVKQESLYKAKKKKRLLNKKQKEKKRQKKAEQQQENGMEVEKPVAKQQNIRVEEKIKTPVKQDDNSDDNDNDEKYYEQQDEEENNEMETEEPKEERDPDDEQLGIYLVISILFI